MTNGAFAIFGEIAKANVNMYTEDMKMHNSFLFTFGSYRHVVGSYLWNFSNNDGITVLKSLATHRKNGGGIGPARNRALASICAATFKLHKDEPVAGSGAGGTSANATFDQGQTQPQEQSSDKEQQSSSATQNDQV